MIDLIVLAVLVLLTLASCWGLEIPTLKTRPDRRKVDLYRVYNEQEDRTETLFDRRSEDGTTKRT